ncbi:hypothetical protein OG799_14745 [Micromonospora sp. NBC_00898]|uniref:hypothetical protein n=1 Tax=Micromonospora sp. NBC_00898 TaxID=2975981 RepID=UPI0038685360|nr:hypothetical protein OG799_14745 [Micromonospora sp. NBC_00898]
MPDTTPTRSSRDAVLPDDVTDPLLWRAAYDVAAAHEPDEEGRCPSLLCGHQSAPCEPMVNARRAMRLARAGTSAGRGSEPRETPVPRARDRRAAA